MFSGIIERTGTITATSRGADTLEIVVQTGLFDLDPGESIAVNGVCLTVTDDLDRTRGTAPFVLSRETLDRTALGGLAEGARVNLERAVTPTTRLSGHIVQGHVDGIGHLAAITPHGETYALVVRAPAALGRYMVEKGSIAIDGISLTINALNVTADHAEIGLMIVPHTWTHTVLGNRAVGDALNIEVDVIAKYVESLTSGARRS